MIIIITYYNIQPCHQKLRVESVEEITGRLNVKHTWTKLKSKRNNHHHLDEERLCDSEDIRRSGKIDYYNNLLYIVCIHVGENNRNLGN